MLDNIIRIILIKFLSNLTYRFSSYALIQTCNIHQIAKVETLK